MACNTREEFLSALNEPPPVGYDFTALLCTDRPRLFYLSFAVIIISCKRLFVCLLLLVAVAGGDGADADGADVGGNTHDNERRVFLSSCFFLDLFVSCCSFLARIVHESILLSIAAGG